jgi:riboflavin synthase
MVFQGIIEEIGTVISMKMEPGMLMRDNTPADGYVLKVALKVAMEDAYLGCSIAVNGVCLTVTEMDAKEEEWATFGISAETVKLTNLIDLKPGDPVNVLPEPSTEQHSALHIAVRCDNRVAWAG